MMDYAIWEPKHDGHAPPNWREGMVWGLEGNPPEMCHADPSWFVDVTYLVPAEALNSPNDDASEGKPTDPRKSVHEALAILRDYSPDELAKHGITLAPERDWATELWAELLEAWCNPIRAIHVRDGRLYEDDRAAIKVLRARFEQMIAERSKA
jgi:hypothetical protein